MALQAPSVWVPGMSEDGTDLKITLDSATGLTGLTAAEADATTGDARKIFRALCAMMAAGFGRQTAANLPTRMKCAVVDFPLADGYTRKVYSFSFDVAVTAEEVAAEA